MNSFPKGMSASVLKTICSIGEYMAERIVMKARGLEAERQ